jgi:tight adherence protein B
LHQAGVGISPLQFGLLSCALGAGACLVTLALTRTPLVAIVPAGAVAVLPRAYYARRRAVRLRSVLEAWPDGLRDLAGSIAAGCSLTQAVTALATTGPAPLRDAFARFPAHAPMLGTVAALEVVQDELADPASDRVLEVLVLAHERGGAVVKEILEDLVVTTTKDVKVLDEIEVDDLEMKINARAVLALPWFVLVALVARAGAFRDFYRSTPGFAVVLGGAALCGLGYVWISRLGRTAGEPRVLGGSSASAVVAG